MTTRRSRAVPGDSRWARLRRRYRWLDHLVRGIDRYIDYGGYQYVASISYFTLLSLIPMLMVGMSVAGFVLAGQPELLQSLSRSIANAVPGSFGDNLTDLLTGFIEQRTKVGLVGLAIGLYSGWNWMNALRDALTAMWDKHPPRQPLIRLVLKDLLALLSLTAALMVSFALTASGGALGGYLLRLGPLAHAEWAHTLVSALSIPIALLADWLVFLWVFARLPREPVGVRSAMRGAIAAAIGFELLKQAGGVFITLIGSSPTGVAFGSAIGLLFFIALVSRMVVVITAWTATASDAPAKQPAPPGPAVIRPVVTPRRAPLAPAFAGAVTGALATLAVTRLRRRP
ncbi:YhjD/YihY/BrkB family envelope integrity protein [Amycolatopsis sp. CA-230715]|uniref:YhjD/YihY/BrkB family envelope integrity protein n=1 Tax=Amycolatopsis sp. CA-230715 TaxID=2745196 RepID=UPI001C0094AE|nr:YhjD/YihY/BrkB family envelope integrity protein [Amycolatopsis sp. CA-230715]